MRRFLSSGITVAFLLSLTPNVALAAYPDVQGTRFTWAYDHLTNRGMVQGYPDGTGRPNTSINRAEAVKVLLQARPEFVQRVNDYRSRDTRVFSDVGYGQWYDPYVAAARDAGMVTGYPDGTFHPENQILFPEALGMILRSYGMQASAPQGQQWYQPYLDAAQQRNLLYKDDRFDTNAPITRGQFFDIVYRLEIVLSQNLSAFQDPPELANVQQQPITNGSTTPLTVQNNQMQYQQPPPTQGYNGSYNQNELQYRSSLDFAITIPKLNIKDLKITHPSDALTSEGLLAPLQQGVGHLFSFPGNDGKVLIYGHSSGYSWDVSQYTRIFRRVNELTPGDRVYLTFDGKMYIYEVTRQNQIDPKDVTPFMGTGEELILFTCWPPDSTTTRLLVHAKPITAVALR
jgi:LPXTG-site transpeptidase (sortase) family protein